MSSVGELLSKGSAGLSAAAFAALAVKASRIEVKAGPARSADAFGPVFLVATAWIALLYVWLYNQSATAVSEFRRLKREALAKGEKPPTLKDVKYGHVYSSAVLTTTRTVRRRLRQVLAATAAARP